MQKDNIHISIHRLIIVGTAELQIDRYRVNHKDIANYVFWKVALRMTGALLHIVSK